MFIQIAEPEYNQRNCQPALWDAHVTKHHWPHSWSSFHSFLFFVWVFQFSSVTQPCPTLCNSWTAARQASLSITNSQGLLRPMSIESVMPSSHLILCCPLLLLTSIFPSIRVFSNESVLCIRWPKLWSFSFSISPSNEYSGLISFRIDWLDLLVVQGTLKSPGSRFDAWDRVLRAGALGWLWGMGRGERQEGGSGWRAHVHPWLIHVSVWQKPLQHCKVAFN